MEILRGTGVASATLTTLAGFPSRVSENCFIPDFIHREQIVNGIDKDLKEIRITELIETILTILDARDPYTLDHSFRVTEVATLIARDMNLPKAQIKIIHEAAYMHDIGKIGIPDSVLNKAGRLDREEMRYMQAHPRIGYNVLVKLPLFRRIADIVLFHHERWDGMGYPNGLKKEQIPLESRIIAVADAFDAITSDRPYRKGQSLEYGIEEIQKHQGDQFDPLVVEHFLNSCNRIPAAFDILASETSSHAFAGHNDLMHSRRLL